MNPRGVNNMPVMYGVPLPGHPLESDTTVNEPAKQIIDKQASEKLAQSTEMKPEDKEAERIDAVKKHEEAVKLLELAKSPKDKQDAEELVKFWQDRIDTLTKELSGQEVQPSVETKETKVIQPPDIFSKIEQSATKRVKNPRNKRHAESKPVKKVQWLI